MRYIKIDLLRGLFALSVVITHALIAWTNPPVILDFYNKGFIHLTLVHPGVVGFIVLSGFCIHWATLMGGQFSLAKYGIRRAFRILPVVWCSVVLGMVSIAIFQAGEGTPHWLLVAARFLLLAPLLPINAPLGNSPLDTVVIEAWLYVVYPVFYFALFHKRPAILVCILAICAVIPPLLVIANVDRVWAFTNLIAFLPLWWIGMLAADIKARRPGTLSDMAGSVLSRISSPLMIGVIATMAIAIFFTERFSLSGSGLRYLFQFIVAIGLAKLLVSDFGNHGIWSWTGSLGLISYSLYAVHYPIIDMTMRAGLSGYAGFAVALLSVFVVALLTYWLVEGPSHRLAHRISSKKRASAPASK